jgi:hypothetical protein
VHHLNVYQDLYAVEVLQRWRRIHPWRGKEHLFLNGLYQPRYAMNFQHRNGPCVASAAQVGSDNMQDALLLLDL